MLSIFMKTFKVKCIIYSVIHKCKIFREGMVGTKERKIVLWWSILRKIKSVEVSKNKILLNIPESTKVLLYYYWIEILGAIVLCRLLFSLKNSFVTNTSGVVARWVAHFFSDNDVWPRLILLNSELNVEKGYLSIYSKTVSKIIG